MVPFLPAPGPDPAARFDAFIKAHPAFVATLEVSIGGKVVAKTTLRSASAARKLRFDAKGAGLDYTVSSTAQDYIELDRVERTYDQRPPIGGYRIYDSRFSSAPQLLPGFLMGAPAQSVLGGGKTTVAAVPGGDELRGTVDSPDGPVELRLLVDPKGKPLRFSQSSASMSRTWRLTSFADVAPDPAPFRIVPPVGYIPHVVPDLPAPLAIGGAAPLKGWRQAGKTIDLGASGRGKPRLLAVLGDDSPPSRAAGPTLRALAASLPVFVIGPGGIADPSGALMKRLSPPGTPMFYLVGADGRVAKLWFGFDSTKAAAWKAEVIAAAQGGSNKKGERAK